ncbi:TIGR01440 family protein [Virgibacillus senegalensis]|uniref:TIGR01440 family protein n=1 Tax=Virgibacillus senegalensis TaxID=1499679 RepID=UPI00069FDA4B|nr:TIGR01440 family protein [Virgibacillus senegalensis]
MLEQLKQEMGAIVDEWLASGYLRSGQLFVVGCSTSEVAGERIGTAGSEEVAAVIFKELQRLQQGSGVQLAIQCCEHLNRSLVMEQSTLIQRGYQQVTAVPVPKAGGSMAAYAYKRMEQPVLAETVSADAGLDIGETMIGMHLRRVAVPLRFKQRTAGNARVNMARTRPKLIGGERAVYPQDDSGVFCD